jgi:hypothetical protein
MDISEIKKISDRSYDIALAKQNALEKAQSRLLVAHEGHIFLANAETINIVRTLDELHSTPFCILDTNNNPVQIAEPKKFLELLVMKHQEALNSYYQAYKQFSKIR